jgi:putative flavoprotein involved in K+ transport
MPPTVLVTGVDGGHDVNLRELEKQGAHLLGRLRAVDHGVLQLADDADAILDAADVMYGETVEAILQHAASQGLEVPAPRTPDRPTHVVRPSTLSLRDAGVTSIIWATGYSFEYDWLHVPCLGPGDEPVQTRGVTELDGLYFLGLHWMHTFKSATFMGIGDDAGYVIDHLVEQALGRRAT